MDSHIISNEWSTRPDDQRFLTRDDLHAYCVAKRERSLERGTALKHLRLSATDSGDLAIGNDYEPAASLSHWAFGQLCTRAHAPAGYLRSLPAALAAIPLQYSMEAADEEAKILARREATGIRVDAFTSGSYGRIYDAEVTEAVQRYLGPEWKVPAASYASSNPKRATTLYASDRDVFIALVDDSHPIEAPDSPLFRGLIFRNSEVGFAAFEIFAFLYRRICDNRIIWGGKEIAHLRIRHTAGGPTRFLREARPALQAYATASTASTLEAVQAAQTKQLASDTKGVAQWLESRGFTKTVALRAVESAEHAGENPRSLWGIVQGLTEVAHSERFGDERFELEKRAGRLMAAV